MTIIIDEERVRRKLAFYGLLNINSFSHMERQTHIAHVLPLSLILQNYIAITATPHKFKVSSGIIFNSRDSDENVVIEAEKLMNSVAVKAGVTLRKTADVYWIETEGKEIREFEEAADKIMEAVKELNQLFAQNEHVREECLRKKYSTFFSV